MKFQNNVVFAFGSGEKSVGGSSKDRLVDIAKHLHAQGARILDVNTSAIETFDPPIRSVTVTITYEAPQPIQCHS